MIVMIAGFLLPGTFLPFAEAADPEYGTVQIKVIGQGVDKFFVFDENEEQIGEMNTLTDPGADGITVTSEKNEGINYIVKVNNVAQTVTAYESDIQILAGAVYVRGFGNDSFFAFDDQDMKLGDARTNEWLELLPGTFVIRLNGSEITGVTVGAGSRLTYQAGSLYVQGFGAGQFFVYDGETELVSKQTAEGLEIFPGSYTVKLNNTSRDVIISALKTEYLQAGAILVNGTGDTPYTVTGLDSGDELGDAKTGKKFEVFAGDFIVDLNGVSWDVAVTELNVSEKDSVPLTVSVFDETVAGSYSVSLTSTDDPVANAELNKATDWFPRSEPYYVTLNGVQKEVTVTEGLAPIILNTGVLIVTAEGGSGEYNVLNDIGEPIANSELNAGLALYPGTYYAMLHLSKVQAKVSANAKTEVKAAGLSVTGTTSAEFLVNDADGVEVVKAAVNESVFVLEGTYSVLLNSTIQDVTLSPGDQTVLNPGVLSVSGGTGLNEYDVTDLLGNTLVSASTDQPLDLFAGGYRVALNGVAKNIQIEKSKETLVEFGRLIVTGEEGVFYTVYDMLQNLLVTSETNNPVELFPGDYSVDFNGILQTATVSADAETTLLTRNLGVSGEGIDEYFIFDDSGKRIVTLKTGETTGLFEGKYTVLLNGVEKSVSLASDSLTLYTGLLEVEGTGEDSYIVYDVNGKKLGSKKTNNSMELFDGDYRVVLNGSVENVTIPLVEDTPQKRYRQADDKISFEDAVSALSVCIGKNPSLDDESRFTGDGVMGVSDALYVLQMLGSARISDITLVAGVLEVTGEGVDEFYVEDDSQNRISSAVTGARMELFPGDYTLVLNNLSRDFTIQKRATSKIQTGGLTVSGFGQDVFDVFTLENVSLRSNVPTGQIVELYGGEVYRVDFQGSSKTPVVLSGQTTTVTF